MYVNAYANTLLSMKHACCNALPLTSTTVLLNGADLILGWIILMLVPLSLQLDFKGQGTICDPSQLFYLTNKNSLSTVQGQLAPEQLHHTIASQLNQYWLSLLEI